MNIHQGAEEKLERMVAQYEQTLLHMCYMYFGDQGLAEDAVQDTFVKAYKSLPAFRGECSEKTWLIRIAMNTCHDMKRSAWFRFVDRRVAIDTLPEPAEDPAYQEEDALAETILRLPAKHKEVILMYHYQQMTLQEIAYALNVTRPAVSKRLKQAYAKLKASMEKEWNR